jgi:hypothetical protein
MAAEETPDVTDETRAEHFFRAESQHSTVSLWRKVRSFIANLVSSSFSGPASWPPVDVVLVDLSTGLVVRRWHEGGEEAVGLLRVLSDDLTTMAPNDFIEKWDVPAA